ncbi:hypothetical protein [Klebsiella sp. BIGb0407]|nr:hypothetical protein [Klebsiella sp. BIGb0407]MCS3430021.1 hypothetical protein [Klebsiella sp. BIGb0407]
MKEVEAIVEIMRLFLLMPSWMSALILAIFMLLAIGYVITIVKDK